MSGHRLPRLSSEQWSWISSVRARIAATTTRQHSGYLQHDQEKKWSQSSDTTSGNQKYRGTGSSGKESVSDDDWLSSNTAISARIASRLRHARSFTRVSTPTSYTVMYPPSSGKLYSTGHSRPDAPTPTGGTPVPRTSAHVSEQKTSMEDDLTGISTYDVCG